MLPAPSASAGPSYNHIIMTIQLILTCNNKYTNNTHTHYQ